jgi:hypothetical protein
MSATALSLALILSACGGGSDTPAPSPLLAKYAGTWSACNGAGQLTRIVLSLATDESLQARSETDYFANADCSGSAGATLVYNPTGDSVKSSGTAGVVAIFPNDQKRSITADIGELNRVAAVPKVLSMGMTVSRSVLNGVAEVCISGVAGQTYCFKEADMTVAAGTDLVLLMVEGNVLYLLDQNDNTSDGAFRARPYRRS